MSRPFDRFLRDVNPRLVEAANRALETMSLEDAVAFYELADEESEKKLRLFYGFLEDCKVTHPGVRILFGEYCKRHKEAAALLKDLGFPQS